MERLRARPWRAWSLMRGDLRQGCAERVKVAQIFLVRPAVREQLLGVEVLHPAPRLVQHDALAGHGDDTEDAGVAVRAANRIEDDVTRSGRSQSHAVGKIGEGQ